MSQVAREDLRRTATPSLSDMPLEMLLRIMSFCAKGDIAALCTSSLLELATGDIWILRPNILSTHNRHVPVLYYNIDGTHTMTIDRSPLSIGILKSVQTILPNRMTQDMGPRCGQATTTRSKSSKHSWVLYYRILVMANTSTTLPRLTFFAKTHSMSIRERNQCEAHYKRFAMSRATSVP